MKTATSRSAATLGIAVTLTLAGCDRPRPPSPPPEPPVDRRGTFEVRIVGVDLSSAVAGTSGPFVFRLLDLDAGGTSTDAARGGDVQLVVNATTLEFQVLPVTRANRLVVVGPSSVPFQTCQSLLRAADRPPPPAWLRSPSPHFCVLTGAGRISEFRILDVRRSGPARNATMILRVEYTAWNGR